MLKKRGVIARRQLALLFGDSVILFLAPIVSIYLYFLAKFGFGFRLVRFRIDPVFFLIHVVTFLVTLHFFDQYNFQQDFRKSQTIIKIFLAVAVGAIITVFLSYIVGLPPQGRWIFVIYCTFVLSGVVLVRFLYSLVGSVGMYRKKTLIVGCGESGKEIANYVNSHPNSGLNIIGFLDKDKEKQGAHVEGYPVFFQEKGLKDAVAEHNPQLMIMAMRRIRYRQLVKDLLWCAQQGIEIWDVPTAFESLAGRIPLRYVDEMWLLFSTINWPRLHIRRLKRLMDIVVAGLGLLISFPVMAIAAVAIKLDTPGPVFYRQVRVGKDGNEFELIKFRSMVKDAEKEIGAVWVGEHDPRITRVGKLLRFLRLDELPQFFNVFSGEMSIVGPRPERPEFVADFLGKTGKAKAVIPFYKERLTVKPGITGWAQVMYPYAASYEESLKKLEYDLYYIKNMSFLLDCLILLKTFKIVVLGRGK